MDTNYLQDDLSCSRSRDFDSVSVCSTASSSCSRDRRSPYNMHGTSGQLPSPGSLSNKISVSFPALEYLLVSKRGFSWWLNQFQFPILQPTPPKKPPRRNLSISPTHATSGMFMSSEQNGYDSCDYAFIRNSSQDQLEYSDGQVSARNYFTSTALRYFWRSLTELEFLCFGFSLTLPSFYDLFECEMFLNLCLELIWIAISSKLLNFFLSCLLTTFFLSSKC